MASHSPPPFPVNEKFLVLPDQNTYSSAVWKYFRFHQLVEDGKWVVCSICFQWVSRNGGSTTTMSSHLARKHQVEVPKMTPKKSPTTPSGALDETIIDKLVLQFIIANMFPLKFVDSVTFRNFIKCVSKGQYNFPSKAKIQQLIDQEYQNTRTKLQKKLADSAIASIIVTKDVSLQKSFGSYPIIKAYWIDYNWNTQTALLGIQHSNNITEELTNVLSNVSADVFFGLKLDKDTDNKMADFSEDLKRFLYEDINDESLSSACYHFQSIIHSYFETNHIAQIISKVHHILTVVRDSSTMMQAVRDDQQNPDLILTWEGENVEPELENENKADEPVSKIRYLMNEISRNWISKFSMLTLLLYLRRSIDAVLMNAKKSDLLLDQEEWLSVSQLCRLLKPFQLISNFMKGDNYPTFGTISMLISSTIQSLSCEEPPEKWLLHIPHWDTALDGVAPYEKWSQTLPCIQAFRQSFLRSMQNLWNIYDLKSGLAAILDPRSKHVGWLDDSQKNTIYEQLEYYLREYSKKHVKKERNEYRPKKRRRISQTETIDDLFSPSSDTVITTQSHITIEDELLNYRAENEICIDLNPFHWWANHEFKYPNISILAKKYLAIPFLYGSSDFMERVKSDDEKSKKKEQNFPEVSDKVLFLHLHGNM